ncbi:MAG: VWA domain-containing protein [Pseudomonadota bacterium]
MIRVVTQFAACCRASDLRVSTSEVLDCSRQMALVDPGDESQFRIVLQANFVKTRRDQARFDALYRLFFHCQGAPAKDEPGSPGDHSPSRAVRSALDRLDSLDAQTPMDNALASLIQGDPVPFLSQVHDLHTREETRTIALKSNLGQLSGKLGIMLAINGIRTRIMSLAQGMEDLTDPRDRRRFQDHVDRALGAAFDMAVNEPGELNHSLKIVSSSDKRFSGLGEKPFSCLSAQEMDAMREVIRLLVRKLKDQVTRRFSVRNRGVIDIKKTLRLASRFQGIPLGIVYKNKPPRKSRIVALCDVSGSVWSAARFMLSVLYSLQECFDRVASFIFVSDLAEVTGLFDRNDINQAIDKALTRDDINYHDQTDYGAALQAFRHRHMAVLNPKTTVIIMGDGRSNYHNPQGHILGEIRERCRRIIWLNPEPESTWGTGDSEIRTYKAWCHEVRTCMNLNHLISFVEELVL